MITNLSLRAALLVGLGFAVAGCEPEIEAALYAADIYQAQESGEPVDMDITVRFQIKSADKCAEDAGIILPILRKYTEKSVELVTCRKVSGELFDLMELRTAISIGTVDVEGGFKYQKTLGAVLIGKRWPDAEDLNMFLAVRSDFGNLVAEIDRAFPFETVNFAGLNYEITLHNDVRDPVEFFTGSHFVNERAIDRGTPFQIKRRKTLQLNGSSVKAAALRTSGHVWLGLLAGEGQPLDKSIRNVRTFFQKMPWEPEQ